MAVVKPVLLLASVCLPLGQSTSALSLSVSRSRHANNGRNSKEFCSCGLGKMAYLPEFGRRSTVRGINMLVLLEVSPLERVTTSFVYRVLRLHNICGRANGGLNMLEEALHPLKRLSEWGASIHMPSI